MTRPEAEKLIAIFLPEVWKESGFLSPQGVSHIPARTVFDAIRESCDPPITCEEFDTLADKLEQNAV